MAILDLEYAVDYAIESGSHALLLELLSSGARIEPGTSSRLLPLHMATMCRDVQSVKALLEHGANIQT
jgi:ankyrin repeat protein